MHVDVVLYQYNFLRMTLESHVLPVCVVKIQAVRMFSKEPSLCESEGDDEE